MIENKSLNKELAKEHGLSLYIETNGMKILFDVGESKKFWKNAEKMGINLEEIDYLILSHGHKDHGGGLPYFIKKNKKAKIYCSEYFFDKHYKKILGAYIEIGIPYEYLDVERFNFIQESLEIENLFLFHSGNKENENPLNESLYTKNVHGEYEKDSFKHELNMVIKENEKNILIVGCAHSGIDNILDYCNQNRIKVETIVGGLHLTSRTSLNKNDKYIDVLIEYLNKSIVKNVYSCHCTGEYGFKKIEENGKFESFEIKTGSRIKF
ncbi:MBL fold metallo-hydrolase [Candidatus Cetobacterium colombiensis]|uniref:MBL fold metallo-hydrolase n=1 Tax=Candidatus Cetobacterium colombiensis TaxID=3073100 RepID=A0ABU4WAD5_9FUSO|nr:MBL fold metallo-hydrolase [Candidatus Cetobacterium colombiensis]MDX8335453.1 MBL fold metallo-hydrolase [Candidatus Cetobacterium colombiensis]